MGLFENLSSRTKERVLDALIISYPNPRTKQELATKLKLDHETTTDLLNEMLDAKWVKLNNENKYYLDNATILTAGRQTRPVPTFFGLKEKLAVHTFMKNQDHAAAVAATDFYLKCFERLNKKYDAWNTEEPNHKHALMFYFFAPGLWAGLTDSKDPIATTTAKLQTALITRQNAQAETSDMIEIGKAVKELYPHAWAEYTIAVLEYFRNQKL